MQLKHQVRVVALDLAERRQNPALLLVGRQFEEVGVRQDRVKVIGT